MNETLFNDTSTVKDSPKETVKEIKGENTVQKISGILLGMAGVSIGLIGAVGTATISFGALQLFLGFNAFGTAFILMGASFILILMGTYAVFGTVSPIEIASQLTT